MYNNQSTLADLFNSGFNSGLATINNLRNSRIQSKYGDKEEEAKYKSMLAKLASAQAQANVAPEYYQGQADYMKNNAGLAGLKMQYMPQDESMKANSNNIINKLRALQMQELSKQISTPYSAAGQQVQDYTNISNQYGENSPQAQAMAQALKSIQVNNDFKSGLINHYNTQAATERGMSPTGKLLYELNQSQQSGMPSDQAQNVSNLYQKALQKNTTDSFTRQKAQYATNLLTTLNSIDPNAIAYYSGPSGQMRAAEDHVKSILGNSPPQYQAYQNLVNVQAPQLAAQARQFYGDSIQPSVKAELQSLANPVTWNRSPQVAMSLFKKYGQILTKETQTYQNALDKPISIAPKGSISQPLGSGSESGLNAMSLKQLKELQQIKKIEEENKKSGG